MLVYVIPPIDDWTGWRKPEDVFEDAPEFERYCPHCGEPIEEWTKLRLEVWLHFWDRARALALQVHWEGDIRGGEGNGNGPWVSMLPGNDECLFVAAWKQDNNGTTFVASPVALPWLQPLFSDGSIAQDE